MAAVVFGAISLILAASGIYTILALAVRQRRREMAVRLARGATALGIVALVLRGVGAWLAVGLTAGFSELSRLGALGRGFLYETAPAPGRIGLAAFPCLFPVPTSLPSRA
jgi:hypothetical protein